MNPTISEQKPKIVIMAGPTAAGKTAASLELAKILGTEIVSADSVQVYRHMDIGSAKPSLAEREQVPHHMVDIRDPDDYFSAGDYVREGRESIAKILKKGLIPLVIGGTGMYIRLLRGGIVGTAPMEPELRRNLQEQERGEPGTLFLRLCHVDPESASRIGPSNVSRIVRALEVFELAGRPLSELQREHEFQDQPYRSLFIFLCPEREYLYQLINRRVDAMVKAGLLDEVSQLFSLGYGPQLRSMQSLGYRHMGMVLAGSMALDDAINLLKRDTRHYAKRQLTWFRSEPGIVWHDPQDMKGIECMVCNFLGH